MTAKFVKLIAIASIITGCLYVNKACAQNSFEDAIISKFDSLSHIKNTSTVLGQALGLNDAATGIMTPSGWGGSGTSIFGGLSGDYPEQYKNNKADLIVSGGVCTGDAQKAVNVAVGINMTDVHRFRDFSGNAIVSREISTGNSISAGALQLFASGKYSDAPAPTYYIAYSHAVQWLPSQTPGCSALSYTIGIGNGRFLDKSPDDIAAGKGKYATAVFGSVSYEILKHTNLSAEWDGQNLGVSLTTRPFPKSPFSIGIGADNLTSYTGDKTSMVFTVGYPLSLIK
jgi:hypothetical protein